LLDDPTLDRGRAQALIDERRQATTDRTFGLIDAFAAFADSLRPEHLPRLTDPFYRADPSRRRGSGGVGLGLYLARAIADVNGGALEVESAPDMGTRVRVHIPISVDGDGGSRDTGR
jgi:light-regulated signal transduction histidine kinase (bacteriophytochrome)